MKPEPKCLTVRMVKIMSELLEYTVEDTVVGERIDKFLTAQNAGFTRSEVQRWIDNGNVIVNAKAVSKNYKLRAGDHITLDIPEAVLPEAKPENIPLEIAYEDNDLLVVNKPKGMVVHPAVGNYDGTLVNALLYYCGESLSGINGVMRPGIVHRIDKDTSGLLIVAKNDFAHRLLAEQIKTHSFTRKYLAVVYGNLKQDEGTINAPIGRNPLDRKKMAVTEKNAKQAITHYKVLERFGNFTYVELTLETGRTHQIRVHMASLGHPVAGDSVYGPSKVIQSLNGQCLHAYFISFEHPRTQKTITLLAELPPYFETFLRKLRNQ